MTTARGKALVYPQRQRCFRCRRYFGFTIVQGLYCSYRCAAMPEPDLKIEQAPRECRVKKAKVWHWKTRYLSIREVPEGLLAKPGDSLYRCGHCTFLHIGHRRTDAEIYE